MKKTGIFGGSFNPVQNAHLAIAEGFVKKLMLDRCLFIPASVSPFKIDENLVLESAEHRKNMIETAIKGNPEFEIETFEIDKGGVSYTIDTLNFIKQKYRGDKFYLLIGSDQAVKFHKWISWKQILEIAELIIAERPGTISEAQKSKITERLEKSGYKPKFIDLGHYDISSTKIRDMIRNDNLKPGLIPEQVRNYIFKNKLYGYIPEL